MFILIKDGEVFAPESLGERDILLAGRSIAAIEDDIPAGLNLTNLQVISAKGKFVIPGFIDSHVHILGGGGEGGFATRTPEITLTDITKAGVTTVVGCLGTDGFGRSLISLIAKARALEEEGVSTYLYVGSYQVPVRTITGRIEDDLMLIDKFIGVGEVAISDHRSSQPTIDEIARIAASARVGGMLSGKAGIVNVHLGDGARKLAFLEEIAVKTEIPITQFLPTHINRNPNLFEDGVEYARRGGYVDFTTSTTPQFLQEGEVKSSRGLKIMLEHGVSSENITFSSDGQGSLPAFNAKGEFIGLDVGSCQSLFTEFRDAVLEEQIDMAIVLKVVTSNPARILKLSRKGGIKAGFDADLILLDQDTVEIDSVIAKGQPMILHKDVLNKGTFGR
ncbi:isoaspartyl dipeptidase [Candidatus Vecturithrix granuli]|uniref:Isoaspartyl dipeptidase n=1 Tax=Vecturithrix granuli TaxID=1499967 RepID=A0A081C6L8_VECG1|nr:isoaspartyl dipeptidase [Candidatus Vecturithrix granuli]